MRSEQLEYLNEIARVNSINKASKNLCISAQALSASMKHLEEELEFQILDTTYKGTQLTEKGEELLEAGLVFLDKIYELRGYRPERRKIIGKVEFYCVPGVVEIILPSFFLEFQNYHPNGELEPIAIDYQEIMRGLLLENFEYAFVFTPMINEQSMINWEERFSFTPLKSMKYYCAINKNLYLASQKSISIKTMLDYDIIAYEPESCKMYSTSRIYHYFDPQKNVQSIKHKEIFNKVQTSKKVVSLTTSLDGTFPDNKNVSYIPLSDKNVWINFGYIKLKNKKLSTQSQMMIDMFQEFLQAR